MWCLSPLHVLYSCQAWPIASPSDQDPNQSTTIGHTPTSATQTSLATTPPSLHIPSTQEWQFESLTHYAVLLKMHGNFEIKIMISMQSIDANFHVGLEKQPSCWIVINVATKEQKGTCPTLIYIFSINLSS